MILLLIAALANPVDTLNAQAHCMTQHAMVQVANICDVLIEAGHRKPPDHPQIRKMGGWTAHTLDFAHTVIPFDSYAIAKLVGEPVLTGRWYRFPMSVQGHVGRCAISVDAAGYAGTRLRYESTTAPAYRPRIDTHCPTPTDLRMLADVCDSAWPESTVDMLSEPNMGPAWTSNGVHYQCMPGRAQARFDAARITPEQLRTVYGPARGDRYTAAPPLTRMGRRCEAKAQFENGRLKVLTAWQAPLPAMIADANAKLPAPAQRVIAQLESACAAGPMRLEVRNIHDGGALRLVHLYQRYGTPDFTSYLVPEAPDLGLYRGRHRFPIPGGRCVIQVDIYNPLDPPNRATVLAVD